MSNECGAAEVSLAQMVAQKAGTPPMQALTAPGPLCLSQKDLSRLSRLKSFQFEFDIDLLARVLSGSACCVW